MFKKKIIFSVTTQSFWFFKTNTVVTVDWLYFTPAINMPSIVCAGVLNLLQTRFMIYLFIIRIIQTFKIVIYKKET